MAGDGTGRGVDAAASTNGEDLGRGPHHRDEVDDLVAGLGAEQGRKEGRRGHDDNVVDVKRIAWEPRAVEAENGLDLDGLAERASEAEGDLAGLPAQAIEYLVEGNVSVPDPSVAEEAQFSPPCLGVNDEEAFCADDEMVDVGGRPRNTTVVEHGPA